MEGALAQANCSRVEARAQDTRHATVFAFFGGKYWPSHDRHVVLNFLRKCVSKAVIRATAKYYITAWE